MSSEDEERLDRTLAVVEEAAEILSRHGADAVVIGGMALAVHNYPRDTEDVDLAVAISPKKLDAVAEDLRRSGWEVEVRRPDAADPLGGVIDVRAPGADLVQVVNFDNSPAGGFPRLVREASESSLPLLEQGPLRVVSLPILIAFKLYAGGAKSKLDVVELLERNPDVDHEELLAICRDLRLDRALQDVLALWRQG